jgi:hypothetical protein
VLAGALPAAASASPLQFSIVQDDATFLGETPHDPEMAVQEARALGADMIRIFITWNRVAPEPTSRRMPAGFRPYDPESPGYRWAPYDDIVERARRYGLRVMLSLAPAIPYWASDEPKRCPHHVGGYKSLGFYCHWKPNVKQFAAFAGAVARRYGPASASHGGAVDFYSMWNEPNLEHYLYPQLRRSRGMLYDFAARRYRELWMAGWRSVAQFDPLRRDRVLFGETAAISSPIDTLYGALCLDPNGKPFKGRVRRLQGCSKPRRLPIGGIGIHPYNSHAAGGVFTRSFTTDSLPLPYLNRLHKVMDVAVARRRIPRNRGIYVTEFGFQSTPPERTFGLSLSGQAQALNESERLFFADPRIASTAQFELIDVPTKDRERADADVYTTGLRFKDGNFKPSWQAWRMPLVVTRISKDEVEIWGQARPADGVTTVAIDGEVPGGTMEQVASATTNPAGYFRGFLKRKGAAQMGFRSLWRGPGGGRIESRVARPGKRIAYLRDARNSRR